MTTNYNERKLVKLYDLGLLDSVSERNQLFSMLGDIRDKKILDLGCGVGKFTNMLHESGADVVGVDNSLLAIETAKKSFKNVKFCVQCATQLTIFDADYFDIIIMASVIPNIPIKKVVVKIFKECARVLRNQGVLLLSIVNPESIREFEDSIRKIYNVHKNISRKRGIGALYSAEYLLADEKQWIKFENTHWPLWFIKSQLIKVGLEPIEIRPHIPSPTEVPTQYLKCYKELPIRLLMKYIKKHKDFRA